MRDSEILAQTQGVYKAIDTLTKQIEHQLTINKHEHMQINIVLDALISLLIKTEKLNKVQFEEAVKERVMAVMNANQPKPAAPEQSASAVEPIPGSVQEQPVEFKELK